MKRNLKQIKINRPGNEYGQPVVKDTEILTEKERKTKGMKMKREKYENI